MYHIIIKKVTTEEVERERWTKVYDSDHPNAQNEPARSQYDNVLVKEVEAKSELIYEQHKEELNVEEVIKAVNNIK